MQCSPVLLTLTITHATDACTRTFLATIRSMLPFRPHILRFHTSSSFTCRPRLHSWGCSRRFGSTYYVCPSLTARLAVLVCCFAPFYLHPLLLGGLLALLESSELQLIGHFLALQGSTQVRFVHITPRKMFDRECRSFQTAFFCILGFSFSLRMMTLYFYKVLWGFDI